MPLPEDCLSRKPFLSTVYRILDSVHRFRFAPAEEFAPDCPCLKARMRRRFPAPSGPYPSVSLALPATHPTCQPHRQPVGLVSVHADSQTAEHLRSCSARCVSSRGVRRPQVAVPHWCGLSLRRRPCPGNRSRRLVPLRLPDRNKHRAAPSRRRR